MLMLRMLHGAAVYAPPGGPLSAALQGLQGQLAPCFPLIAEATAATAAASSP